MRGAERDAGGVAGQAEAGSEANAEAEASGCVGPEALSDAVSKALLVDLAGAEHDVLSLAQRHGLSFEELVDWAGDPQTRRVVSGLCVLADAQTQLLLSRYRLVAATRLIAHATADAEALAPEQIRKACVDLLKTELSRAAGLDESGGEVDHAELAELRDALAGAKDLTSGGLADHG